MAKPEFKPQAILRVDSDLRVDLSKPPNVKGGGSAHSSEVLALRLHRSLLEKSGGRTCSEQFSLPSFHVVHNFTP